jgi:hypothetical protein
MGAGLQATVTGSTYDPDAQLFFNAQSGAGVTLTTTQKDAINQWVIDSKAVGVWTKMKAIYPMVGGTATSHKFNLKNPLDTNAAYRLVFNGGWTHDSNGALPNGTNGYASTFLIPNTVFGAGYASIGTYVNQAATIGGRIIGSTNMDILVNTSFMRGSNKASTNTTIVATLPLDGFNVNSRTSSISTFMMDRARTFGIGAITAVPTYATASDIVLGALNSNGTIASYSDGRIAFAYCSDSLTQNESLLLYQITEKYQVALSRSVYPAQPFYYNAAYNNETNLFLFNTQITDNTIQTATDTLVTDLKTSGIWTKMKALYPIVGGTATTHKFNLVDPRDLDAAFRLVFAGGVTHSSNGFAGNGTNGWANTFVNPNTLFPGGFASIGVYNRVSGTNSGFFIGTQVGSINHLGIRPQFVTNIRHWNRGATSTQTNHTVLNEMGFSANSRTSNTLLTSIDNTGAFQTNTTATSIAYSGFIIPLLVNNSSGAYSGYSNGQLSFAYISDALSSAELTTLKSINQTFQTTLGRQV